MSARLSPEQTNHARQIIEEHRGVVVRRLANVIGASFGDAGDDGASERFYRERLEKIDTLLEAFPKRGGVALGDAPEEEDDGD